MKNFIKQRLHENWGWEDRSTESSPLKNDLARLSTANLSTDEFVMALRQIEDKYASQYGEYEGDTYGVIDAIKQVIPTALSALYIDMHPNVSNESVNMNESDDEELRFNDGKFNKSGANTIYMGENPIVDFGVGGIGDLTINGETVPNALYLKGGYNASEQGSGYGTMGLKFIFQKLPKIQNIVLQCFDTACPFWVKMGGQEIATKQMDSGHVLRTLRVSRDSFE